MEKVKACESFLDYLKKFAEEEVRNLVDGSSVAKTYPDAYELANELTYGINADGSVTCSSARAEEYVKAWFDEAGAFYGWYLRNIGGLEINPFSEPEKFQVVMIIFGLENLLASLPCLAEIGLQDGFALTDQFADEIICQIREFDGNLFD